MPKCEYSSHSSLPAFQLGTHKTQRTHPGVAHIRENHFAGAAGSHHLVVDQIGGGACQHQVLDPLADDLMPGGKGDQVGKAGGVERIAVMDKILDGFF